VFIHVAERAFPIGSYPCANLGSAVWKKSSVIGSGDGRRQDAIIVFASGGVFYSKWLNTKEVYYITKKRDITSEHDVFINTAHLETIPQTTSRRILDSSSRPLAGRKVEDAHTAFYRTRCPQPKNIRIQTIHVCYISLHLPQESTIHVGKYTIVPWMGEGNWMNL